MKKYAYLLIFLLFIFITSTIHFYKKYVEEEKKRMYFEKNFDLFEIHSQVTEEVLPYLF